MIKSEREKNLEMALVLLVEESNDLIKKVMTIDSFLSHDRDYCLAEVNNARERIRMAKHLVND